MLNFKFYRCSMALALAVFLAMAPSAWAKGAAPVTEGILLVAFGTSIPEAQSAFKKVEASYREAFDGQPLEWAFTSQIIQKKLAKMGIKAASIGEGLDALAREGVKIVRVQSLHVMAGEEFAELARSLLININQHPGRFEAVYLGRPLLESIADAEAASKAVQSAMAIKERQNEALVLMAHGNELGRAGLVFEGVRNVFMENNPNTFLATVEGERTFEQLVLELRANKIKKVLLAPLMVVAGDHARNDLAGEEADSWASRLKKAGFEVDVNLQGLGDLPGIAEIFIEHTRGSRDDLTREPKKP